MSSKITDLARWFNSDKGFGFITPQDGDKGVSAHFFTIQSNDFKTLDEGQKVGLSVENNAKGPLAVNVAALQMPIISRTLAIAMKTRTRAVKYQ